ncbi:uncharacterized protein HMPREF1541_05463 [Cyphellophora europaea CBS 101466]|uniref:Fungal N-terminal domain-containing protein n=1 Tax=Cyphellophora europaea (strain CBS 101466) TaxID=1220924 RepID=W2RSE6_CYPE1|nr:uncharacterized protein HMPREF1541_05463 [Cyphellophora europaea CBS 101466]ETN39240.1 hypothetical protein HMPREF1541_05463 [Cyphellophora europaea CBS 101466]
MIVLGSRNGEAQRRLQSCCNGDLRCDRTETGPIALHILIISTYLDNWRLYLGHLASMFEGKDDRLITAVLKDPSIDFADLQILRDLESNLLTMEAILKSSINILAQLEACAQALLEHRPKVGQQTGSASKSSYLNDQQMRSLDVLQSKANGFIASAEVLRHRVGNAIGLVRLATIPPQLLLTARFLNTTLADLE